MSMEFSVRKMKQVFKSETDKRISLESAKLLDQELQEYGSEIVERAKEIAGDNNRVTVRAVDIRKALLEKE